MQLIPKQAVRSWASTTPRSPSAVSTVCPHCGERVTFSIIRPFEDKPRSTVSGSSACPNCQAVVHFWAVHNTRGAVGEPDAIFMYPPVRSFFQASSLSAEVPEPLKRSFVSTVDAFNSRNFVATSVCCRRTLEGIIKYLLPEEKRKGNLIKLIDVAATTLDLAAPLRSLSTPFVMVGTSARISTRRRSQLKTWPVRWLSYSTTSSLTCMYFPGKSQNWRAHLAERHNNSCMDSPCKQRTD